ncbi:Tn3 family transposase [Streptomyces sp. NPDC014892]|uniref:Tn3 family transposase n=1 Tax=Streptomyces sp. NPDC014892 TaxID=3364930 RepID=UPI0037008685
MHSLRRQLHSPREGKVTRCRPEQQNAQAWCLTVVTNAVACWHTEYMGLAVGELRGAGREVEAEVLAHISRPAARRSITTAPSPSTTTANSPCSTRGATARCGPCTRTSPQPGCRRRSASVSAVRAGIPWLRIGVPARAVSLALRLCRVGGGGEVGAVTEEAAAVSSVGKAQVNGDGAGGPARRAEQAAGFEKQRG